MKIRGVLALLVIPASLLTSCSSDVRSLGDVGVEPGMANCVLAETDGIMEPNRLVEILGDQTNFSQAEEEIVARAFLNCIG